MPFYPFLLAAFIILNPLLTNLGEIDPVLALRPLGIILLITAVIALTGYWIFKDWHYASYLTLLILLFFSLYGHIARALQDWLSFDVAANRVTLLIVWGGITLFLGFKKVWLRFGGSGTTRALNIYLGILLIVGFVGGLSNIPKAYTRSVALSKPQVTPESEIELDCTKTPDIYYIILDGYGRADVLESLYGLDNSAFVESLERKGFYVASQSHSNYFQSIFSIPSGLNFSYLESEPENADAVKYFTGLTSDNRLMRMLKGCGYQTIAFETGFTFTDHPQVDLYLSSGTPQNNFENLLLAGTPLDWISEAVYQKPASHSYEGHRERVLFAFEELKLIPKNPRPKMVFAHIISPHPPFVFDVDGNPIQPSHSYSINDGDDYRGDWDEYRQGYTEQAVFINDMLEETLDTILQKSPEPPIIILHGDHGPGGFHDWDSPEKSCLWERSAILNAYYLPGIDETLLTPDMAPVNSFRIVLNEYFDANLEYLPNNTYFTSHRLERQIIEVTDQRDSKLNCP